MRTHYYKRSHALYCSYCGSALCNRCRRRGKGLCDDAATWDHLMPLSKNPPVQGRHFVAACRWCNGDRGNQSILGWQKTVLRRLEAGEFDDRPKIKAKAEGIAAGRAITLTGTCG